MYTVYGNAYTRTLRVLWCLEEIGAPYTHVPGDAHSPEIKAVNPSGKVPALGLEDGTILTDSTAIMTFLADKHAAVTFPAGTVDRARQDGFTNMLLDEIDGCLWTANRMTGRFLPEEMHVPDVIPSLKYEFSRSIARLDAMIHGPFLMGDTFTIPDIILTHCVGWARAIKFDIESDKVLAHAKAMRDRPGYKAAFALGQKAA
ncbi:glutathione S-transferase family protein [Chachezhania sediminis]|uniref:glutathione S-transferase family protein n=1 Tax=Chachezhania sediminis TaxID=2599291 RepID=UPI00131EBCC7|nr:glutathione S-transferase family protein [Chachezhania sediminis]